MITKYTLFTFLLFFSFSLLAQIDIENSEDHPLISRYPGSYIASYEKIKFREYSLATGPITGYRYIEKKEQLGGQVYRITYLLKADVAKLSIGEVYQDYLEAIQKEEIKVLAKGLFSNRNVKGDVGGGSWIGVALKDNGFPQGSSANLLFKGTSSSGGTFSIIGQVEEAASNTHIAIYGERHSKDLVVCHIDIIEQKSAETGKVKVNADYIRKEIEEKGKISIYGITFDFDSDKIKSESKLTLDEIGKFLSSNPKISLYIVGHTDMKGKLGYNKGLSQRRSEAVVNELVETYKIAPTRLQAEGVGPLAPKGTNDTEEGRALNRRVELVKKN